ncbi:MAG: DEAD/DEAH box helicase family protein [Nitrosopumilus sp.]|nr:DEAD/DEAH box helicase family protein [Nitrosopumilus sp.]
MGEDVAKLLIEKINSNFNAKYNYKNGKIYSYQIILQDNLQQLGNFIVDKKKEFDFIVIDECHRSIYNKSRQVLDYFDSFLIGLTATTSNDTIGFFNNNQVMRYNHEKAVADEVNVGYYVYKIRTKITDQGSSIEAGQFVEKRDRLTRKQEAEQLDDDLIYAKNELEESDIVGVTDGNYAKYLNLREVILGIDVYKDHKKIGVSKSNLFELQKKAKNGEKLKPQKETLSKILNHIKNKK